MAEVLVCPARAVVDVQALAGDSTASWGAWTDQDRVELIKNYGDLETLLGVLADKILNAARPQLQFAESGTCLPTTCSIA